MEVWVIKLLKMQLAIKVERRSLSSVYVGKYSKELLQNDSFMISTHSQKIGPSIPNKLNVLQFFSGTVSPYFGQRFFCWFNILPQTLPFLPKVVNIDKRYPVLEVWVLKLWPMIKKELTSDKSTDVSSQDVRLSFGIDSFLRGLFFNYTSWRC